MPKKINWKSLSAAREHLNQLSNPQERQRFKTLKFQELYEEFRLVIIGVFCRVIPRFADKHAH